MADLPGRPGRRATGLRGGRLRPGGSESLRQLTDRRLSRQQRWRLVGVVAGLILVATTVRSLWAAEAARSAWSATTTVVVATRDLAVGEVLDRGDLRTVGLPSAAIPPGAATGDPSALLGARVSRPILAGEPVASARLGPAGLGPTAALLRPGWRAVTIPLGTAPPPLVAGDRVELVAVAGGPGSGAPARIVSTEAEVITAEGDALTVAVPSSDVTDVVAAAATGLVAAVLIGAAPTPSADVP